MPDDTTEPRRHCPYCNVRFLDRWSTVHIFSEDHQAAVKRTRRTAAYRNRQMALPAFDRQDAPQR